jgi:hypothetical protein
MERRTLAEPGIDSVRIDWRSPNTVLAKSNSGALRSTHRK